jgi:hypothetical protein
MIMEDVISITQKTKYSLFVIKGTNLEMQNKTIPIFKQEPVKPKLEWIRKMIYTKQGDDYVCQLYIEVGTGSHKSSGQERETLFLRRKNESI